MAKDPVFFAFPRKKREIASLPSLAMTINVWIRSLVDLVYPPEVEPEVLAVLKEPFCSICAEPFEGEMSDPFRCANCRGRRWAIRYARAAYVSANYVREVIHAFKYEQKFHHLPRLAEWLEEGYRRFYLAEAGGGKFDALVPVPLYPSRRKERGFNQAEELARRLSGKTGIPVWNCLNRIKPTETQTRLRREQRIKNQRGAYALKTGRSVENAKLLIIDDVLTTGATMDSCARTLRKAGAAEAFALTVARG